MSRIALYLSLILYLINNQLSAQFGNIHNDTFWNTIDGRPIYSQGGGIFRFTDPVNRKWKYYWYGVRYKVAEQYRASPAITQQKSDFGSVTCYSSSDLTHWTFEKDVLSRKEIKKSTGHISWVGRLGVAFIKELQIYAMFIQHDSLEFIATAKKPTGPFVFDRQINMRMLIGTPNTGDQSVFTDEDNGKSYLIYSYGKGRNKTYISEIGVKNGKVSLLDCTKIYEGPSREGNCMFKYKGRYYACASDLYGWDASNAYYLVADNIRGPYKPTNDMQIIRGSAEDYGHISQTGFFYTLRGSKQETVIFCGDRWSDFAGNGLGYNQWCPLSFNGSNPYFNSLSSWSLNSQTGEWEVNADNNWVRNGSFEADRRTIPSITKPVQKQLSGWFSSVLKGHPIRIDTMSPALNHDNNKADRQRVTGKKSLCIEDNTDFKRKVSQVISSSPFVKLPAGQYTLTAKIKNSPGFTHLSMYAKIKNRMFKQDIKDAHITWTNIRIKGIPVKDSSVEIGFLAEGTKAAFCYVDDVVMVKDR